jgi:hypothetical protein
MNSKETNMEEKTYVIAKVINKEYGTLGYWDGLNFIHWKGFTRWPDRVTAEGELKHMKWWDKHNHRGDESPSIGAFVTELKDARFLVGR